MQCTLGYSVSVDGNHNNVIIIQYLMVITSKSSKHSQDVFVKTNQDQYLIFFVLDAPRSQDLASLESRPLSGFSAAVKNTADTANGNG